MSNLFLLTGAGFSKNYNGFLAKEMISEITNDNGIVLNERLKRLRWSNGDYELIYQKVMNLSKYSDEDRNILNQAIKNIYQKQDVIIDQSINVG